MTGVNLDLSEVTRLSNDLGRKAGRVRAEVEQVVNKGALKIKNQMRDEAKGHKFAPRLPSSITYTVTPTLWSIGAEIGPVEGHAGSLAFYYYGNSRVGPSIKDPAFALKAELPVIEAYLAQFGAKL